MKKIAKVDWVALLIIVLLSLFYFGSLTQVPFHPDESTHIYMSKDSSQNPLSLAWDGVLPLSNEERIRAIDAPLAKYLIGLVRGIFSISPLEADWMWGLSWEENSSAGALPSDKQLLYARSGITILLPMGLWLYYLALKKVLSPIPSLAAVLLLGLHPLVLLHGRRALSEGPLFLGIALFLWAATREKGNPWLTGLALGIAVNAKHSSLGLIPAAVLAASILPFHATDLKIYAGNLLKIAFATLLIVLMLNPFYWKYPLKALNAGSEARFSLAREQQEDYLGRFSLGKQPLRTTIPALILNTYLTAPQTEEVGNYLKQTQDSKERYLANSINTWGRDRYSGSILAALTLGGIGFTLRNFSGKKPAEKRGLLIFAFGTLGMGTFIIFLLPWQRYALAILPFTCIWAAAGLTPFTTALRQAIFPPRTN